MLGIESANAPGGAATLDIGSITNVAPDDLPEDWFDFKGVADYIIELIRNVVNIVTWGNYTILNEGGGVVIRMILSFFSLIGVIMLVDTMRRWLRI